MHVTFAPNGILQIDNARIIWPNFSGKADRYNKEGDRHFTLIIPDQEIAERMMDDTNEFGVGWNVKIKPPREEGDNPFIFLKVKVKFNGRGPVIHLQSGSSRKRLDEESISCLDYIDIRSVDLDIRPYDDEGSQGPFRAAYLHSMEVIQEVDRFTARYNEQFDNE